MYAPTSNNSDSDIDQVTPVTPDLINKLERENEKLVDSDIIQVESELISGLKKKMDRIEREKLVDSDIIQVESELISRLKKKIDRIERENKELQINNKSMSSTILSLNFSLKLYQKSTEEFEDNLDNLRERNLHHLAKEVELLTTIMTYNLKEIELLKSEVIAAKVQNTK